MTGMVLTARCLPLARRDFGHAVASVTRRMYSGKSYAPHMKFDAAAIPRLIERVNAHYGGGNVNLFERDYLQTWDVSDDGIAATLDVADALQHMYYNNVDARVWQGRIAVSHFRDASTRTRFSFASACALLGLNTQDFDEKKSQIQHGETVRETANMVNFLSEIHGIRDDLYVNEGHEYMAEVGAAIQDGYDNNVLAQRATVINLQSDRDHPTQALSDLLHFKRAFGDDTANLRGKKVAVTWAHSPSYGKPLSVPQGNINLLSRMGMHVTLAAPPGYNLMPGMTDIASANAAASGGSFSVVDSMDEAFADADIVYPKSWAPYEIMLERMKLLRAGASADELAAVEKRCLAMNAQHKDWECNAARMALTKDGSAMYAHCLPADITGVSCEHGEVTPDVLEQQRHSVYKEAENKNFIIAAMMLLTRRPNVGATLAALHQRHLNGGAPLP